ncbi:MAG: sterol-binding protein [Chloroflexi bacterium]|nr:MAG: sterol-binding protein [Chloroflexota bacterium]MBL1195800.1 sterol-binding protein [Chloroflexota bacterium]NOH13091.1 SCP2 sterol-binding domain-containing protein [Chloroflexota bacterium]
MALTIKDLMDRMPDAFVPEKAEGVDASIQFHFTGDEQSDWYVEIKDGACKPSEGTMENPTLGLTVDAQDYIDMVTGKLDAMAAFMQGKLKLQGDLNLAMKMVGFFDLSG